MTWLAAALALCSAVAAGWSTALMHYGASGAVRGARAGDLARHVVSDWRWRLGVAASLVGLALHAAALHFGTLTVVQPLAVTALFFSMVFRDLLDRRRPPRRTVTWGAITAVGLGLFLTAAGPTGGSDLPDGQAAALLIGLGAVGVLVALRASRQFPAHAGLLLGTAGGIVFGLMAGAIKSTTSAWSVGELFTSWPVYAMVTIGLTGFLLNQHIYNWTRLPESLPMLNLVNPLVALAFGVVVFAERPSGSLPSLAWRSSDSPSYLRASSRWGVPRTMPTPVEAAPALSTTSGVLDPPVASARSGCGRLNGGRSRGGRVRFEAAQAQAVRHHEHRRERHRGAGQHRVEQPGGGQRQRGDVVGERPEQVALDRRRVRRESRIASTATRRSPRTSVRSLASIATSVPVPIARPRSAWRAPRRR